MTVWVQIFSSRCRSVFRLRVSSLGVHQIYLSTTSTLSISLTVKYAWFGLKLRESSWDGIKSVPWKRQLMILSGRKGVLSRYRYLSSEVRGAYLSHHMGSSSSLSALKLLSIARSGNRQPSNRHLITFRLGSLEGNRENSGKIAFASPPSHSNVNNWSIKFTIVGLATSDSRQLSNRSELSSKQF